MVTHTLCYCQPVKLLNIVSSLIVYILLVPLSPNFTPFPLYDHTLSHNILLVVYIIWALSSALVSKCPLTLKLLAIEQGKIDWSLEPCGYFCSTWAYLYFSRSFRVIQCTFYQGTSVQHLQAYCCRQAECQGPRAPRCIVVFVCVGYKYHINKLQARDHAISKSRCTGYCLQIQISDHYQVV